MDNLRIFGIIHKQGTFMGWQLIKEIIELFREREMEVLLDIDTCEGFPLVDLTAAFVSRGDMAEKADAVIVIGGDGTFLGAARDVVNKPLIGINMGTLGFLTETSPENAIRFLEDILNNRYVEEKRSILRAHIPGLTESEESSGLAFNDVVVTGRRRGKMANFDVLLDDRVINRQRGDGTVFATPTGSTAYALSAGGPILSPELPLISMVSINPHSLGHRPLILSDRSNLCVVSDTDELIVSLDGAQEIELSPGQELWIRKSKNSVRIIHPVGYDYYEILRGKLGWGSNFVNPGSNPK